ncbi:hypothetical protein [Frankia sp. Cr2]|uniref:hypothetical protein n=1 Tax=Frankia sp. Cr2 TaxID=3073932 RepID=UPI002AD489B8|nr:hypothetical protein [Frankia sp. Cr2]
MMLAAVLFGVSACAIESKTEAMPKQGTGERMKPLVDQFKDARARAKSDFERAALDRAIETGKIDPADYEQAFSRYRQCAQDAGLKETYTKLSNGIYRVTPPSDIGSAAKDVDAYANVMKDCAAKAGLISLEALYRTQVDNPDLLADPKLVVVRCLIKAGLVPADYSTQKLTTFLNSDMEQNTDFDPMNAEAQKCLTAGGIAISIDRGQKGGS